MSTKHFKDLPHYIPLFGILGAGTMAFFVFSYDKQFQIGVAISIAGGHLAWGIVHHLMHNDFRPEIVLEYLAISILGLVAILSLILQ